MASRDLTASFKDARAAFLRKRPLQAGGGRSGDGFNGDSKDDALWSSQRAKLTGHDLDLIEEGTDGGGIQMSTLSGGKTPSWVNQVDKVEQCLTEITRQMQELQSMHATRVGSVFGRDLSDMEGRIEKRTQEVTDLFRSAEKYLSQIGITTRRAGGQEAQVGANIQRSLAKRLQEQSQTFRQSQRKYLAEVQAQKSGTSVPNQRFGIDLEAATGTSGTGEFFTTQQLAVVDDLTQAVQSRDQEIQKIAQSIEELGTIFKELAVLVIDQGTILDRIDYNMEAVVEHTKTGIKQLEKAEKHQKNARPMRCIVCLSIIIFVLLIILVIKHRPRRGWL